MSSTSTPEVKLEKVGEVLSIIRVSFAGVASGSFPALSFPPVIVAVIIPSS